MTAHGASTRPASVLAISGTLLAARLSLRFLGFAKTLKMIKRVTPNHPSAQPDELLVLQTIQRLKVVAALFPGRFACLERSVVLFVLLRRTGLPVELRIGVQPHRFRAHAWVELDGRPISGPSVAGFVAFAPLAL